MNPSKRYPITIAELQRRCPLVKVESTDQGLVGKQNDIVVLRVRGDINRGTIERFQTAYSKADEAGLLLPRLTQGEK